MSSEPFYRLTVAAGFSASHQLRNFGGKCEALHGHNFGVEMSVVGQDLDPKTHLLVDFGLLKQILRAEVERYDHTFLNEVEPFDRINPSSENIARTLFEALFGQVHDLDATLESVTVCEKPGQSATYCVSRGSSRGGVCR